VRAYACVRARASALPVPQGAAHAPRECALNARRRRETHQPDLPPTLAISCSVNVQKHSSVDSGWYRAYSSAPLRRAALLRSATATFITYFRQVRDHQHVGRIMSTVRSRMRVARPLPPVPPSRTPSPCRALASCCALLLLAPRSCRCTQGWTLIDLSSYPPLACDGRVCHGRRYRAPTRGSTASQIFPCIFP